MDDSRRKFVQGVLALGALAATGGCMQSSDKPARWISGGPDVDPVSGPKVKFVRTICLGCHDALAYLKSLNKSPWAAIQTIVKEREELIKAIEQKDAQLKELSQKFIDLSLRLMPAMPAATPSSQTPGTGFSVLPRTL